MFQEITAHDPGGVVLGYSWIDDSATGGSFLDLIDVYRSEAYANLNGIRLANALVQALTADFFKTAGNELHIVGHSHGSKVATTAALALQSQQKFVPRLTLLDSPETEITLSGNGANLLGFYLPGLSRFTFVDSYASIFGVSFPLNNVVNVALNPSKIYSSFTPTGVGDQHSYAAAWYAGAAVGAQICKQPKLGLDWPPPPAKNRQALNQTFPLGLTSCSQ